MRNPYCHQCMWHSFFMYNGCRMGKGPQSRTCDLYEHYDASEFYEDEKEE